MITFSKMSAPFFNAYWITRLGAESGDFYQADLGILVDIAQNLKSDEPSC
jgi:hypothetical protein